MGCDLWFYKKVNEYTLQDVIMQAVLVIDDPDNEGLYTIEERDEVIDGKCPLTRLLMIGGFRVIDDNLCLPLQYNTFLFRTFDYDAKPLHSLDESLEYISKVYKNQKIVWSRLKRTFRTLNNSLYTKYMLWFKNTHYSYTHTHKMKGKIELHGTYHNTCRELENFWYCNPNAIITFG